MPAQDLSKASVQTVCVTLDERNGGRFGGLKESAVWQGQNSRSEFLRGEVRRSSFRTSLNLNTIATTSRLPDSRWEMP
jgi:hypothetical protein